MIAKRFLRVFTFLLLLSSWSFGAAATDFLKAKQAELTSIIKKPASAQNDAALRASFDALLDYDALAESSLEDEWPKLSPEQRKEFKGLLTTLVQRAYTKSIRDTLDYDIAFKAEAQGKRGQIVQTVATHKTDKRKEPISIDYVVRSAGGAFRVVDIITEGSSLVQNYRNQFKRVIQKKGFAGLMERMRAKANDPA